MSDDETDDEHVREKRQKTGEKRWKPIDILRDQTVVVGGFAATSKHEQGLVVPTMPASHLDPQTGLVKTSAFVHTRLNDYWFLMTVGGTAKKVKSARVSPSCPKSEMPYGRTTPRPTHRPRPPQVRWRTTIRC